MRWATRVAAAGVASIGLLWATGAVSGSEALSVLAVVEAATVVVGLSAVVSAVVVRMRRGVPRAVALRATWDASPFAPLVRAEIRAYTALWRWMRGGYSVPAGAVVFPATRATLAVPVAFAVVTLVELAVLHVLVPWSWLRTVLAVLSLWSLVVVLGMLALHRTHPHFLHGTRLVLRHRGAVVTDLDLSVIGSVVARRQFAETSATVRGRRLSLPTADGTVIDLVLCAPVDVVLPALSPRWRRTGTVDVIGLYVDDPQRLTDALRPRAGRPQGDPEVSGSG